MEYGEIIYLSRADVEQVGVGMKEIIDALEAMFLEKGEGRVEMPPKPGIHTQADAFIHAMPAYIPSMSSAGIKWVGGYPDNQKKGLPYITGLMILNDPETGFPTAVMDATWITAKRTGAATAVAAKHLARPESSRVGILACGVQGRSNLEALACVFEVTEVKAFDLYSDVADRYAREMSERLGLRVEAVRDPEKAVRGMDLVVTSGPILKHPTPTIPAGWLAKGAFASAVDFDSFWTGEALGEIDRLATDDLDQMAYYRSVGYFKQTPEPYADLGQIVAGAAPSRRSPEERTMAINLGLALDDMATAPLVLEKARALGVGTKLRL